MPAESTDTIKNRIIRNASRIWGYPDAQDINSFDPILGLLIGSLAEELHNISGEIEKTEARIIEKTLELLFKQNVFTHFPAHALLQASPSQAIVTITDTYQFYYNRTLQKKEHDETVDYIKKIYFTPTGSFNLFKGSVRYFLAGGHLYECTGQLKETLAIAKSGRSQNFLKLIIGFESDPGIVKFDGLSLLFLVKNKQDEERFYHSLSSAKFQIGNKEVVFNQGYESEKSAGETSLHDYIQKEKNLTQRSKTYINEFYRHKFLTLSNGNYLQKDFLSNEKLLPDELVSQFPAEIFKSFPKNIVWLEVLLTQPFTAEFYSDLTISMNCFPVINRELNESTHSVIKGLNAIPLLTEDIFFDLKRVTDSTGAAYNFSDNTNTDNIPENTCIIRQSGITRFDSRDAKQIIKQVIDLVKNEGIAFSVMGSDIITSELKQLNQIITRLQQRVEKSTAADDVNSYILIQSKSDYERIYVQFWSTCGELANNIRIGSKLSVYSGSDLDDKNITLITNSFGGRQKLSEEDKLNKLRSAILSDGRIVTVEDIKALCFEHFGPELNNVEVKKGVQLDPSPQKGFVRTLDLYLFLTDLKKMNQEMLNHKLEGLKTKLKQGSINLLPFRIFVR